MHKHDHYVTVPFPKIRQPMIDAVSQARRTNTIHTLLEADVTEARALQREFSSKLGEPLSFTSFLTFCLARAVDEDKMVQACRTSSGSFTGNGSSIPLLTGIK